MQESISNQVALLMQGTHYGDEGLKAAMADELGQRLQEASTENRPLRVYCGFDPRTADLHLGHTVQMRKLRQFQTLGHEVTFVVGNFTSLIGDPSDKDKLRPTLTREEVEHNAQTYAEQAFKILDPNKTAIRYNADWLSKLTFRDLISLASNFSIQQFLTRESFRQRWDRGDAIYLHETFYALMQGYDAYTLQADVQVGGSDQLFNIVTASRKLMTYLGAKPNIAVISDILPGTDGVVKMSKSLGNHIPLLSAAEQMYGKIMSLPDVAIVPYLKLVTRFGPDKVASVEKALAGGTLHPRDAKMELAREVVSVYCSEDAADRAQQAFVRVFRDKLSPADAREFPLEPGISILDVLARGQLVESRSEARRLLRQGAVTLDGEKITDPHHKVMSGGLLRAGKRRFLQLVV